MKTRSFVLGMFAFAALCACNKEAQPAAPEVLDADTYVKVNIMATPSTRAFEAGDENAVKNALFLFYDASGNSVHTETVNDLSFGAVSDNNVATSAIIKLPAKQNKPTSMLVVLNFKDASKYAGALSTVTGTALVEDELFFNQTGVNYFLMTNSAYSDGTNKVYASVLTDANFGKAGAENAEGTAVKPVDVYVERVAAKALLTDNTAGNIASSAIPVMAGSPAVATDMTITPKVVGFDVVETPKETYSFKQIDLSWSYDGWNDKANYRSYWAETASHGWTDPTDYHYKVANTFIPNEAPIYLFENTSSTTTKVVLVAQLTNDGTTPVELVRYNNTYYTLDAFKAYAAGVASATTGESVDVADLSISAGKIAGLSNNYEMYLTHSTPAVATVLKEMTAMYWNKGYTYYFTDIKHDLTTGTPGEILSGVVRNHVYKLTLNSIQGLGVSVPDPTQKIDPETPSAEYYSLNATVNILSWKIVEQSVDFNN